MPPRPLTVVTGGGRGIGAAGDYDERWRELGENLVEPEEVAPAVAWPLGPGSGYVTGAVLRVAGGL